MSVDVPQFVYAIFTILASNQTKGPSKLVSTQFYVTDSSMKQALRKLLSEVTT